jgi:uncharacterized membrane protein
MRESSAPADEDKAAARGKGSFARGLLVALPLSFAAWLVIFWLV